MKAVCLGKVWLELIQEILTKGIQTQDYKELFNIKVTVNEASDQDSIVIGAGLSENIVEMRKVFFTEEENKFGHSYSKAFVGPFGNYGVTDIITLLKKDNNSKRAVLTFVPYGHGKVPCINFIHFMVRQGRLKVHYFSRGQDIYNKFACDAICIMDMATQVAQSLEIPVEEIVANISSAHIYDEDLEKIHQLLGVSHE